LEDVRSKYGERDGDLERALREKEEELEIYKSGMDQTLLELNELKMVSDTAVRSFSGGLTSHRPGATPTKR